MNRGLKFIGGYWITIATILMLVLSIVTNFKVFEYNDFSIMLGFIGVLATIIVIGNYAQVIEIKNYMNNRIDKFERKIISYEVDNKSLVLYTEGIVLFSISNNSVDKMYLGLNKIVKSLVASSYEYQIDLIKTSISILYEFNSHIPFNAFFLENKETLLLIKLKMETSIYSINFKNEITLIDEITKLTNN